MDKQTARSPSSELVRIAGYFVLSIVICVCVTIALLDNRIKSTGLLLVAFLSFGGIIALAKSARARDACTDMPTADHHQAAINPASGLPMIGTVDTAGNVKGSNHSYK